MDVFSADLPVMAQMNGNLKTYTTTLKEDTGECRVQKSTLIGSVDGQLNPIGPLKSLVPPHCDRKFENVQEYLKEVRKALGERQSFYSVNLADILWKMQKWYQMLPNVGFYYAVKANPDPVLLKLLVLLGSSFDCATEGEIQALLDSGAAPSSILWAHTVKPTDALLYARSVGVDYMTFDDEEELRKIHKVYPEARLLLRVRPSKVMCRFDLSLKFGCYLTQAPDLLGLAQELDMNVVGISFHVGALCTDVESFTATIQDCRELFDLGRQLGLRMSVLDIGGGFFGSTDRDYVFTEVVQGIKDSLEEHFGGLEVEVIAEPGCYLVGSAFDLVCTVLGKRTATEEDGVVRKHYFLNNGTYGSFFKDILDCYDVKCRPLLSESEVSHRPVYESMIYGQTCCPTDVIQGSCRLPELESGECLLWDNMGAYSSAVCSTFCGVPLPVSVYVYDKHPQWTMGEIIERDDVREFLKKHVVFFRR